MKKKLRIGWITFTCSEDSSIIFIELMNDYFFEWKEKMDFAYFKLLRENNNLENLDVAFIEGAVSTKEEEMKVKEVRKKAKKVVAVGSCALSGLPAGQRNLFSPEKMKRIEERLKKYGLNRKVEPVEKYIRVDYKVPGCPMNEKIFLDVLNKLMKEFGVE